PDAGNPHVRFDEGRGNRASASVPLLLYRHPNGGGYPSLPPVVERSRNVSWNQRLHKVRSYRGLGVAHTGQCFATCASAGSVAATRTHRRRRDVCATPAGKMLVSATCRGTKPE